MIHDLETTQTGEGYAHRCKVCGATKETAGPNWFAACHGPECIHLGEATNESVSCKGCKGSPAIHAIWTCAVHGSCLPTVRKTKPTKPVVHYCDGCGEREC